MWVYKYGCICICVLCAYVYLCIYVSQYVDLCVYDMCVYMKLEYSKENRKIYIYEEIILKLSTN